MEELSEFLELLEKVQPTNIKWIPKYEFDYEHKTGLRFSDELFEFIKENSLECVAYENGYSIYIANGEVLYLACITDILTIDEIRLIQNCNYDRDLICQKLKGE